MLRAVAVGVALAMITGVASADIFFRDCTGDCDGDGQVRIAELVLGVKVALGEAPLSACRSITCDATGLVSIACLIDAVDTAMGPGCVPVGDREQCGLVLCPAGEVCCNPLYNLCTPPGGNCIQ